ncbi:MAG TPA: type II toxin-antitoxin system HicB family antitoxin [Rhizomicrobium sp.]|jgi:predicted RNase H-like HicB family nuclease|nr:type II toxin-antitoxin system HicB family antitoxin [Rhizomicrobium sp.]
MAAKLYPAILEKAEKKTFAVWLPDFPDCVAAGRTQEDAIEKITRAAANAAMALAETDTALPPPTPMEKIEKPKNFLAFVMVPVSPPDASERVNVYLPKRMIAQADARAAELGMSRSSFFGLALSVVLGVPLLPGMPPVWPKGMKR